MAQAIDGINAVVHDAVITFDEVREMTAPYVESLRRQYQDEEQLQKKSSEAAEQNIEKLVERQLILHDFDTAGYNLPESIIDQEVQEQIRERFGDRAKLTKSLQAEGITYEKYRKRLRDNMIERALRSRNVSSEILISPHKIEVYYTAHADKYQVEDQVKLRMIVLKKPSADDADTRKLADEILSKIKEGATFTEMASVYSQGSQRGQQGDWGWVERSVLRKELSDVAFTLDVGQNSGVIDTPEAIYIMRVEEKRPAHVRPLSEVRDEIEKIMIGQEQARLQKIYIEKLRQKTYIRYF